MILEFHAPDHIFAPCRVFGNRVVARDWLSNAYLLDSDARIIAQNEIDSGVSEGAAVSPDGRIFFCSDHSFVICDSNGKYLDRYEFDDYPARPYFMADDGILFGCGNKILSGTMHDGFKTLYEGNGRMFPLLLDSGNLLVQIQTDNSPKKNFIVLNPQGEVRSRLPEYSCSVGLHPMSGGRIALWHPRGGVPLSSELQVSVFSEEGDLLNEKCIQHGNPIPVQLNDNNWAMTAGTCRGNFIHILDDSMSIVRSYSLPEDFNTTVFGAMPDGGFIAGDREGKLCFMSKDGEIVKVISMNGNGELSGPVVFLDDGTIVMGSRMNTLYFIKQDKYTG